MKPCVSGMHLQQNLYKTVTDRTMKKFGLIGHPIAHSLSPALFKAAFGGKYTYDLIEEDAFEKAYVRFIEKYDAINVTAPFKEAAYRKADSSSEECQAIGAANILIKGQEILAANSDVLGVTGALQQYGIGSNPHGKALIVGCGGAAMAAAYAVWKELGHETFILNRNVEKARQFATRLKAATGGMQRLEAAGLEKFRELFRQSDVIIYTLPLAISSIHKLNRRDIRGGIFRSRRKVILEANYKEPAFTQELTDAMLKANRKLTFIPGQEWLLHQAIGAYRFFVSDEPDIKQMRKVISAP